ncbi:MAG TPA: FGGY family carbohydrate kinase [Candidatus Sumerlaeota bacterium]|nr:FGGY family carbohydrate kinase [Candidatus Sumerlaeota bacterium]
MTQSSVIGVDLGSTNVKALLVGARGHIVARAAVPCPVSRDPAGRVTQAPALWLDALDAVVTQLRAAAGSLEPVAALALSCQADTLVACDATGRELAPAISWMDQRAHAESRRLERLRPDWRALTGKPMSPYSPLAKILWLRAHEPDLAAQTRRWCQPADYLAAALTGQWVSDLNSASFSHGFSLERGDWDPALLAELDLEGTLAPLRPSGQVLAPLRDAWRRRLGLPAQTQFVLGGHDQACASLGIQPPGADELDLSAGTAWVLFRPVSSRSAGASENLVIYRHAVPDRWALLAAFPGGGVLEAFLDVLGVSHAEAFGPPGGGLLATLAADDLRDDLIVLPFLLGASSLDADASARAAILGLRSHHRPRNLIAGLMRAVAFEARRYYELFQLPGDPPRRIKMMGGASRGPLWPQLIADACNTTVVVLDEPDASALGAAFLAGCGAGLWSWDGLPAYPHGIPVSPDPARTEAAARAFADYRDALVADRLRRARESPVPSAT